MFQKKKKKENCILFCITLQIIMKEKRRENKFLVDTFRLENVSLLRCVSRTKARALVSLRGNKCVFV